MTEQANSAGEDDAGNGMDRRRFIAGGGSLTAAVTAGMVAATAMTASPASAQTGLQPVFIPVGPFRVYDSRKAGSGKISAGQTRRLVGGVLPEDFAQLFNVTVTGTTGTGYLSVYPGDQSYGGSSSINWFGPNQTLGNNAYTAFDLDDGGINIRCGAGSTHFILDLVGVLTILDMSGTAPLQVAGSSDNARTESNSQRTSSKRVS